MFSFKSKQVGVIALMTLVSLFVGAPAKADDVQDLAAAVGGKKGSEEQMREVYLRGKDTESRIKLVNSIAPGKSEKDNSESLLHFAVGRAAKSGDLTGVEFLLSHGALPDAVDKDGETALFHLMKYSKDYPANSAKLFKLMLAYGAGPNAGKTKMSAKIRQMAFDKDAFAEQVVSDSPNFEKPTAEERLQARITRYQETMIHEGRGRAKEIADQKAIVTDLNGKLTALTTEHTKLKEAHATLVSEKAKLDKEHADLIAAKARLQTAHDTLDTNLKQRNKEYEALDKKHNELIEAKRLVDAAKVELQKKFDKLKEDYDALVIKHADIEKKLGKTEENLNAVMTAKGLVEKQLEKLDGEHKTLTGLHEQLKKDHEELKKAKGKVDEALVTANKANETLQGEKTQLTADKKGLEGEKTALTTQVTGLKKDNSGRLLEVWSSQMKSGLCSDILEILKKKDEKIEAGKEMQACEKALEKPTFEVAQALLRWERLMHDVCNGLVGKETRKAFDISARDPKESSERLAKCGTELEKATNPDDKKKSDLHQLMAKASQAIGKLPKGGIVPPAEKDTKEVCALYDHPVVGGTHSNADRSARPLAQPVRGSL